MFISDPDSIDSDNRKLEIWVVISYPVFTVH